MSFNQAGGRQGMPQTVSAQVMHRLRRQVRYSLKNPSWLVMDCLSRFAFVRDLSKKFRAPPLDAYPIGNSPLAVPNVGRFVQDIETDGVALGLRLPGDMVEEITAYARTAACYGDGLPQFGLRYPQKAVAEQKCERVFSQATFWNVVENLPAVVRLSRDPLLLSIAARYFGSEPCYVSSRLWWSFATDSADWDSTRTSCFFHFDKDDYASLRFFFYLTDVDEDSGPHQVIKTSHRKKKLSHLVSLGERDNGQIAEAYGPENLLTLCGKAGMGFAEDPYCFHRGTRPTGRDRLLLVFRFATKRYGVMQELDPASLRDILD